jgi:hypothetical protein
MLAVRDDDVQSVYLKLDLHDCVQQRTVSEEHFIPILYCALRE